MMDGSSRPAERASCQPECKGESQVIYAKRKRARACIIGRLIRASDINHCAPLLTSSDTCLLFALWLPGLRNKLALAWRSVREATSEKRQQQMD